MRGCVMRGVYVIEHIASGRLYVGKSLDIPKRIREHFIPAEGRRRPGPLHRAIAKYGREAFRWSVLEECPDDAAAVSREVHWIRTLATRSPRGFNLTDGGEGLAGRRHSDDTRAKIAAARCGQTQSDSARARVSASLLGNRRRAGKPVSAETRQKIGEALRGRTVTSETRAKISAAHKGRPRTPEHAAKIAAALRGRKLSAETRKQMSRSHSNRHDAQRKAGS